jgi:hypothetical protein
MAPLSWHITVRKRDLVAAVGMARTRATLRRVGPKAFEPDITLAECPLGLSIRSSHAGMDIEGLGTWPSPIAARAAVMRRLLPKLEGLDVVVRYRSGLLFLNSTGIDAREI